ncbi:MAG: hypothetical protein R2729_20160 [Bryobacteraceae bacterium]
MLDFRKSFLALAVLALGAGSAFGQVITPLSCTAQAAGTPSIRAEGVAELVGDVLIICNGGTPNGPTEVLRQVNIQIFTQPSVNVTSRLLASGNNDFTEAMLFVDEPAPGLQHPCGNVSTAPYSVPPLPQAIGQPIISGVCGAHVGSPTGNGIGTYDPRETSPFIPVGATSFATYRPNAFQARRANNSSLIWQGIPFDAPGTLTTRILRMTNIRVNASQLGVPAGSQADVRLVISTSASGVINPIALPITNPSPTVAIAQNSLDFSVVDAATCLQCESANVEFAADSTRSLHDKGSRCDGRAFRLRYQELFPSVLRRRSQKEPSPLTTGDIAPNPSEPQDTLGFPFQTETGFYKNAGTAWWPTTFQNGTLAVGESGGALGLADHGTRLIVRFNNVQNGLQIWVGNTVPVNTIQGGSNTSTFRTGTARLIQTNPNGDGPFSAAAAGATPANLDTVVSGTALPSNYGGNDGINQVSVVGGVGQAVYEIINADTTSIERVEIPVIIAYRANTAANLPSFGTATANGNLAPISTVATASTTAALPRFVDTAANRNVLTVNSCRTNLLFPFVSNQAGFDTGVAIANTSKDPFGTSIQTGACTVNFYGVVAGANVCLSFPSPSITGGEHFVWSLSSGGAVTATAGFQGYIIAQCAFQYGHGFAFISDLGAQRLAMGYLALVMDDGIESRTGSKSETLGH